MMIMNNFQYAQPSIRRRIIFPERIYTHMKLLGRIVSILLYTFSQPLIHENDYNQLQERCYDYL